MVKRFVRADGTSFELEVGATPPATARVREKRPSMQFMPRGVVVSGYESVAVTYQLVQDGDEYREVVGEEKAR